MQPLQAAVSFQSCCNRFCAVAADLVIPLHSTRQPSRTTNKRETLIEQEQISQTEFSQGPAPSSCSFLPRLLQSILRRRRRFGCCPAQHTSALTRTTIKREMQILQEQLSQTSSHKVQHLQAAVAFHDCCNRFCAIVADLVVALHSTRQRWRRATHKGGKYTAEQNRKNITRYSIFTMLISPVFTRAANKARSAAGTPQLNASIVSEWTSNSHLPNFTFAMEYPAADTGL